MAGQSPVKKIFSGSVWGIAAKVLDALAKFVTIPLLVSFYGKTDYGLIALAFSLNAYLRLMDLGMNIGSVRYFAMWESKGEYDKIATASRSSMVFYGLIGLVNALIFVWMADHGPDFFNISQDQAPTYRIMMYILAASTVFNWLSNVVIQLLSAKDELGFVHRITVISSVLNFLIALAAIHFQWSLEVYFLFYTLSLMVVIPLNVLRLKRYPLPLRKLLLPKWDGKVFKQILGYSMAIFAMGLFQFSAKELRPILLAKFATGIDVLTDYRVIQTIANLVMSFGSIFLQVLLPSASKAHAENDQHKMEKMVFEATRYIAIFLTLVVFALILNAENLLVLYMGESYADLSKWLIIWLLTVLLSMHNTPVASLVLSSGKTKALVYSAAIGCILSLPITVVFAPEMGVGAAVMGYLVYMLIQMGFFYFYYIPKVLHMSSARIFFKAFSPSLLGAVLAWFLAYLTGTLVDLAQPYLAMALQTTVFLLVFAGFHGAFVIKRSDIDYLKSKLSPQP
ncbi:lipopolysaccharide biosynthesis protein [Echinicola vietnamensis]|uniref:Membrane protein involved in the export of O-antigen and teichoic acid n=1 Tax=Echinicola vietnamensis (strain DSM 17526 / LMG 23754 / KMM 6221) TaxID=926556 RepID=L0G602_ECHVK|nr:oligosaccharide flippase family protein [Echinicola vietnamensis]AGA80426.1 membrane protein involved in the export of O-antigen and teichoic acid [Echinicola vietnamensis DSM 17526]